MGKEDNQAAVSRAMDNLRRLREAAGIASSDLDESLILGPGWIESFETMASIPDLGTLLAICSRVGCSPTELFADWEEDNQLSEMNRLVAARQIGTDLEIRFPYGSHNARYLLPKATEEEFQEVLVVLRDGLAGAIGSDEDGAVKADSVARTFLEATKKWPSANPSDLWWFVVYRAYCDPFNHPAKDARLDFGQSWKRTGGWALEEAIVRHYGPFLLDKGIRLFIALGEEKTKLIEQLDVSGRLEADKVDILLAGRSGGADRCFGAVHVKASFAERRTDDVPLSRSLVEGGYCSPLWTMDCKSGPAEEPLNKGELGVSLGSGRDRRSAKRKDIEDDGYFSACFSYNTRTRPTPTSQDCKARIHVCDFKCPDDSFSRFICDYWEQHRQR